MEKPVFKLQEAKKRKWTKMKKECPFPVPVQTITGIPASSRKWCYFTGRLVVNYVAVTHSGDMDFLFKMGFFGKGHLSRNEPEYGKEESRMSRKRGENKPGKKEHSLKLVSRRRYLRHKAWESGNSEDLLSIEKKQTVAETSDYAIEPFEVLLKRKQPIGKEAESPLEASKRLDADIKESPKALDCPKNTDAGVPFMDWEPATVEKVENDPWECSNLEEAEDFWGISQDSGKAQRVVEPFKDSEDDKTDKSPNSKNLMETELTCDNCSDGNNEVRTSLFTDVDDTPEKSLNENILDTGALVNVGKCVKDVINDSITESAVHTCDKSRNDNINRNMGQSAMLDDSVCYGSDIIVEERDKESDLDSVFNSVDNSCGQTYCCRKSEIDTTSLVGDIRTTDCAHSNRSDVKSVHDCVSINDSKSMKDTKSASDTKSTSDNKSKSTDEINSNNIHSKLSDIQKQGDKNSSEKTSQVENKDSTEDQIDLDPRCLSDHEDGDLFVLNDTDESDCESTAKSSRLKWEPAVKRDPFRLKEDLHLSLEEAFFLSYGLGCLVTLDANQKPLNLTEMWQEFCKRQDSFVPNYVVYHCMRSKGWVVKHGLKFGGNFLVYKDGPPFYHASYVVLVRTVEEVSTKEIRSLQEDPLTWRLLAGQNRVTEQVGKELMICYVIKPKDLSDEEMASPKCISRFKVQEVILRRWISKHERDNIDYIEIP